MVKRDLKEFRADHEGGDVVQGGEVMEPTDAEGGPIQRRLADAMLPAEDESDDEVYLGAPGNAPVKVVKEDQDAANAFSSLFEGMDVSADFKNKIKIVFEAAVEEAAELKIAESVEDVNSKVAQITEELEEKFQGELSEAVTEAVENIVENLDAYLDYVVAEWMEENKVAIEAGIKVEMAESFMENLKTLFYEHNVEIDEEKIDVVASLEEELAQTRSKANAAINESIELAEEIKTLRAEQVFSEVTEGLTTTQAERLRVLSEKLNFEDLNNYRSDLATLKESFFKTKRTTVAQEEDMILTESAPTKKLSSSDTVNALAAAISSIKTK